jgi:hypothetical protein
VGELVGHAADREPVRSTAWLAAERFCGTSPSLFPVPLSTGDDLRPTTCHGHETMGATLVASRKD